MKQNNERNQNLQNSLEDEKLLTREATPEMVREWKQIYEEKRSSMKPNRKTGAEVDEYLRTKYSVTPINTDEADKIIIENIVNNQCFKEKLPDEVKPKPVTYYVGENKVFVGIDLVSGYFCVEGSEEIYDDLFAFRGLDERDLDNFFLVAEYDKCTNL